MKCYLWFSVWNIYVEWKQTQNKNTLKEWLLTKNLKYSVIFIWHAHDIIDHIQGNQGNSFPGLAIFNFFSFPDDRSLCLSISVRITCCEVKYEEKRYCLNEEFDWLYLPSIKIYWCHAENKLMNSTWCYFNIIVNDYLILAPMGWLVLPKHKGTNILSGGVTDKK